MLIKTRKIIDLNVSKHDGFEGYYLLIEKVQKNVNINPDISIEACKSLIEWISKFILTKVDNTYKPEKIEDLWKLVKRMFLNLWTYSWVEIEDILVSRLVSVIIRVWEIRNSRWDVSHGKIYPKDEVSDINLSNFIASITDELLFYVLNIFFNLDFSSDEWIKYEDNEDFNDYLDEENDFIFIWKKKYSEALFELEPETYVTELTDFKLWDEENIEEIEEVIEAKETKQEECKIEPKKDKVKKINKKKFNKFCLDKNIDSWKLEELLNWYIFTWIDPTNDDIALVLNYKPEFSKRREILKEIKENLDNLIIEE